ncbi:MAG: peptidoglycan bridge formation glycyltransferase FemA/FemB family protein [Betaproteobacteria bacterium]|nr:peptidoglycan bridge formation glycyltransferase FemA/FemB family protein [Betaproteobacteria bacterium]
MIRLEGRGAVYGEVWFEEELPREGGVDIVLYRQRRAPVPRSRVTPFLTMITDLAVAEDALIEQFGKDCRYKVRRADARDGLRVEFVVEPRERLEEFRAFFDTFARQKGVAPCDAKWLGAACDAGQLALASAAREDERLVWHAYLLSGSTAWLQYSASRYRDRDNAYRALVGRANRWLHWQVMLQARRMGLRRYDWGGLFEDESEPGRAGINRFKRDFGGEPARSFECALPVTARGRLYLPLREAWRRLRFAA